MDEPGGRVEPEPLEDHGREFHCQDGGVEHDAPGHLEHDGVRIPVDDGMPDAPGLAQIKQQSHDHEAIAQKAREDRRAHDGFEAFEIEEVDHRRQGEGARGEPHAAEQVEADPEAPGEPIAQVRDGAQALGEPDHRDGTEGQEQHDEDAVQNPGRNRRGLRVAVAFMTDLLVRGYGFLPSPRPRDAR